MDLIFSDKNMKDLGVLQGYSLDMAYGKDENNFVVTMELDKPVCEQDYFIYIENTEYGGIIDEIGADTSSKQLTYSGRTWSGILASKIIEPNQGEDYFVVSGDANQVVSSIINKIGLDNLFEVSEDASGVLINGYQFRYNDAYTGILTMLNLVGGKLMFSCYGGKVHLRVDRAMNYAAAEDFDSSIIQFSINRCFNKVNHLVCLGSGELKERRVIHLFTDDNGGIQPYLYNMDKLPIKDEDYILDDRNKRMNGIDEIISVLDYPNAGTIENYEMLEREPDDWRYGYVDYFEKSGDSYQELEQNIQDVYELLTSQPSNWDSTYDGYYTKEYDSQTGEYTYLPVEGDEVEQFERVTSEPRFWQDVYSNYYWFEDGKYVEVYEVENYVRYTGSKPSDWETNYNNYYTTDGVNYSQVGSATAYRYNLQTQKPSDWSRNWKTEYYITQQVQRSGKWVTEYVTLGNYSQFARMKKAPKWEKNKYYTRESYSVAPDFSSLGSLYYLSTVPSFELKTVYQMSVVLQKTFEQNKFYRLIPDQDVGIAYSQGRFFRQVLDHYGELVASGIQRLMEMANADTLNVTLDETDGEYNIGDIIGATEHTTGVSTAQPITKKIIKIERDVLTVRHEVD